MGHEHYVSAYDVATIYAGMGNHGRAMDSLRRATEEGAFWLIALPIEPLFDPMRGTKQFEDLCDRIWSKKEELIRRAGCLNLSFVPGGRSAYTNVFTFTRRKTGYASVDGVDSWPPAMEAGGMSRHDKTNRGKPKRPKTRLGLLDLDQSRSAVLDNLRSRESKRGYRHAIDEFISGIVPSRASRSTRSSSPSVHLCGKRTTWPRGISGFMLTHVPRVSGLINCSWVSESFSIHQQDHKIWKLPELPFSGELSVDVVQHPDAAGLFGHGQHEFVMVER